MEYKAMLWLILLALVVAAIFIGAYFSSSTTKGKIGESIVAHKLNAFSANKEGNYLLRNLYVPKANGDTTEIDEVYITSKGLIVIECKNYKGYIFGNENSKNWTVTLYGGKDWLGRNIVNKYHFFNPITQNKGHIYSLQKYLNMNVECFSIVIFTDRGELKNRYAPSKGTYVIYTSELADTLNNIYNQNPDVLNEEARNNIYKKLLPLTNKSEEEKTQHIGSVNRKYR